MKKTYWKLVSGSAEMVLKASVLWLLVYVKVLYFLTSIIHVSLHPRFV